MPVNHRPRRDVFFCGTGISKLLKTPAAASIVAMTNTTVMMILFIFQHPSFLLRIDSIIIIGSSQGRTEKKALHPRKSGAYVFPSVKNQSLHSKLIKVALVSNSSIFHAIISFLRPHIQDQSYRKKVEIPDRDSDLRATKLQFVLVIVSTDSFFTFLPLAKVAAKCLAPVRLFYPVRTPVNFSAAHSSAAFSSSSDVPPVFPTWPRTICASS